MGIACCGFGHRDLYRDIKNEMQLIVEYLVEKKGVTIFYTGGMGDFDDLFIKVVKQCKIKKEKEIHLILVMPYLTKEMQHNKEYYKEWFDEIIIPEICSTTYYKQAIPLRNRWMIEQSEFVVSGVYRDFGGAYSALQYAERKGKEIIDVYNN
ncbi:MAG: DUF1273 domain-containing protein [Ruminococcaceae bacterium]|nr:DUF1273 domain-containing protein [Oscillospiraceae bacterium]